MKIISKSSENEMISVFLKAEINSPRFGKNVESAMRQNGVDRGIIDEPNINDPVENRKRVAVLGFRGYPNRALFTGFPPDVEWELVTVDRKDLEKTLYIKDDYWIKLSNETRLPTEAAKNIRAGVQVYGQSNQQFIDTAEKIKLGAELPEMIIVGDKKGGKLVVIEGHLRLTSYMLAPDYIPKGLKAIVGYSENMNNWELF